MEYLSSNLYAQDFIAMCQGHFDKAFQVLHDDFLIDFSQPIDRMDTQQMVNTGLFLTTSGVLLFILLHRLFCALIADPLAKYLFPFGSVLRSPKNFAATPSQSSPRVTLRHVGRASRKDSLLQLYDVSQAYSKSLVLQKRAKLSIALWRAFNYASLFIYGLVFCFYLDASPDEPYWILDYENLVVPIRYYSWPLAIYYHLSIAHYLYGLWCLVTEPKLKDFYQMLSHHCVTLFLEIGSYYCLGYSTILGDLIIMIIYGFLL